MKISEKQPTPPVPVAASLSVLARRRWKSPGLRASLPGGGNSSMDMGPTTLVMLRCVSERVTCNVVVDQINVVVIKGRVGMPPVRSMYI